MTDSVSPLQVLPHGQAGEYLRVTPESAGWEHLGFAARLFERGEEWESSTEEFEYGFVVLGGTGRVRSSRGEWRLGRRADVFSGMPYGLYLPPGTRFTVTAESARLDVAFGWSVAKGQYPPCLVSPKDVAVEIRGGGNA